MANILIIDGNSVYEIDEECVKMTADEQREKNKGEETESGKSPPSEKISSRSCHCCRRSRTEAG